MADTNDEPESVDSQPPPHSDAPEASSPIDAGPAAVIDEAGQVEAPDARPDFTAEKVSHEDKTRRYLAIGGMILLGVLAIGGMLGWLFADMTSEQIQSFAVIFSPVVAILGPILGFYFSKAQK